MQFPAGSPSRKELGNRQPSGVPSPKTIQLSGGLENFSAHKRNLELLLRDTQHRTEMTIMQRTPKLQKGGNYDPETIVYPSEGRTKLTGHEKKKWTDVCLIQVLLICRCTCLDGWLMQQPNIFVLPGFESEIADIF